MRLGELVEMRTGYPFRKRIPFVEKDGCRLVQMGDVSATKGLIWDSGLARVEAPGDWQKHVLHCGDLLFVARGVRNETATFGGEAADVIAAPHLFVMRCNGRSVSAEYLGWYLNLPETRELIKKVRGGSAVPFVPMAALAGLDAALAQQRAAIAEWRQSLQDLRGSVRGLGQSLSAYQSTLGQAADDVTAVNRQARQLESWADGVLATAR